MDSRLMIVLPNALFLLLNPRPKLLLAGIVAGKGEDVGEVNIPKRLAHCST